MRLADVAELNPRIIKSLAPDEIVSFVPMASVDADSGTTTAGEERAFAEVAKGYTQFVDRDLLVAKITPCFENGKIAQAVLAHRYGAGSTEFHVVRPDRSQLDDRYLLRFLRQPHIRIAGERRMTGSGGQRRVPEAFLASLEIPLPPLAEQQRIAGVLDDVNALQAKRRRAITRLDDLARSVFLDMFGDPVTNPHAWPTRPLEEFGSLDRGVSKHRPRNDPLLLGGPYPLIQTGDVALSGGYINRYRSTYSEFGLAQSKLWPAGTLCITIAANIAKVGILQFDACFPDSVVGFTADANTIEFVRAAFSFFQERLEELAPQSAQKNINLETLRSLGIPDPGQAHVDRFAGRIAALEAERAKHRTHLAKLDELFLAVQSRAFAGTLFG